MTELQRIVVFCVIIFCTTVYGISNIDSGKKEKIDNFVNRLFFECDRHSNLVGMNLAIVYEGEIFLHKWVWSEKFRQVVCFEFS